MNVYTQIDTKKIKSMMFKKIIYVNDENKKEHHKKK